MREGNDGSFSKDRGFVTKGRRGFDVLASGVKGLKLSGSGVIRGRQC
jgi:hypothetical protein